MEMSAGSIPSANIFSSACKTATDGSCGTEGTLARRSMPVAVFDRDQVGERSSGIDAHEPRAHLILPNCLFYSLRFSDATGIGNMRRRMATPRPASL